MAVPAYMRNESKAKYITTATQLAAWTLKWCKDERLFTRRERWIVTGDIWTAAKGCLSCVKKANRRRDVTNDVLYAEREAYLRQALDCLTEMKALLTIKYEMVLQGYGTNTQARLRQAGEGEQAQTGRKNHGGKRPLDMDDIDRIFDIFFTLAMDEEGLIEGIMRSDADRHAQGPNLPG